MSKWPRFPSVRFGQKSKAVHALQNGLRRALVAKGLPAHNLANGAFGSKTRLDLARFKRAYITPRGPISGKDAGSAVWQALKPFLGEYDKSLIRQHNRAVMAARAEVKARQLEAEKSKTIAARRARLKAVGLRFYAARAHYVYRQYRPMADDLFSPEAYDKTDCSTSFTLLHKSAGEPDPNGRGYDGYGYTGTLKGRGKIVQVAEPGDGFFYGDQGDGVPRHVVFALGANLGVSFGSTPVRLVSRLYRRDYTHTESYL